MCGFGGTRALSAYLKYMRSEVSWSSLRSCQAVCGRGSITLLFHKCWRVQFFPILTTLWAAQGFHKVWRELPCGSLLMASFHIVCYRIIILLLVCYSVLSVDFFFFMFWVQALHKMAGFQTCPQFVQLAIFALTIFWRAEVLDFNNI